MFHLTSVTKKHEVMMNPSLRSGLKTKKAPSHRGGQVYSSGHVSKQASLGSTILQKLDTLAELIKKKDDKPLTFKEACVYLGYAPSYLYKLTYRNVIPHYKPTGKMIFFSKSELDEWIFTNGERRMLSAELKREDVSTSIDTKDPNQIEMDLSEEVLIEFPLKSRRRKGL